MKPPPNTVLMTKASPKANVMHYMHCVPVSLDMSGLESAMIACLNAAEVFSVDSVIISASGLTSLNVPARECADAILKASEMFSIENFTIEIAVVVFGVATMQIFKKAFEEKVKQEKSNRPGVNKMLKIGAKEEVVFRVIGFHDNVSMSIQKIEAYFNRSKVTKSVKEQKILRGLWQHVSQIKKLSNGYDVFVTLTDDEICIEGIGQQVFECKDVLMDFLIKHDEKENELKRLREISKSVQWSYSDVRCTVLFDDTLNGMVESAFVTGNKKFTLEGISNTYVLDFEKMVIQESITGRTALLARKNMENNSGKLSLYYLLVFIRNNI
jgi:hypothetical protein